MYKHCKSLNTLNWKIRIVEKIKEYVDEIQDLDFSVYEDSLNELLDKIKAINQEYAEVNHNFYNTYLYKK